MVMANDADEQARSESEPTGNGIVMDNDTNEQPHEEEQSMEASNLDQTIACTSTPQRLCYQLMFY